MCELVAHLYYHHYHHHNHHHHYRRHSSLVNVNSHWIPLYSTVYSVLMPDDKLEYSNICVMYKQLDGVCLR